MAELALPGGTHGQIDVGYAALLEGLEQNGTAKGSMNFTAISDTNDDTLTFEIASAGNANGNLAGYAPLEIHLRLWDGTTQVAGKWNTNLTGDSATSSTHGVIAASGFTVIECYDLFLQDGNLYVSFTSSPTTGQIEYKLVVGRDRASAS